MKLLQRLRTRSSKRYDKESDSAAIGRLRMAFCNSARPAVCFASKWTNGFEISLCSVILSEEIDFRFFKAYLD